MALGPLTRLVLRAADYDPHADSAGPHAAKDEFCAADGYELEYAVEHYHVTRSGRTVSFPREMVRRAHRGPAVAEAAPEAKPAPHVASPEAAKQYAANDQRSPSFPPTQGGHGFGGKHNQGKRR